jgi:parallel beta-helix repeat protein
MRGPIAIAIAAAALWLAAPAWAGHVSCGQTITTDTTLDADLTCPEDGVVVGAEGVKIDLGGHTVTGDGTGPTTGGDDDAGIRNPGWPGAEITNGRITGFEDGVFLRESHRNHVHALTVVANGFGISANTSAENRIDHNIVLENQRPAINLRFGSFENTVEHNAVSALNVSPRPFWGIFVFGAHDNRVADNSVTGFSDGIALEGDSARNVVEHNVSEQNGAGITLGLNEKDSRVTGNLTRRNAIGIRVEESRRNRIDQNEVHDNDTAGIALDRFGFGGSSTDNVIEQNQVSGSPTGVLLFNSDSNSIVGNTVSESDENGILITPNSDGNEVRDNTASGNGLDGINVQAVSATITSNSAFQNGAWGIEAASPASDGGGNRAWSNGEPAQCRNVVCGPGPPATLALSPESATNMVGDRHCVTAVVADPDGRRTPGIVVRFSVDSGEEGSVGSDANGQSEFCYDGPLTPRSDAISAYADTDGDGAQDPGEPADSASKSWVLPASSDRCRVRGTGSIVASNGDAAAFRIKAHVHNERSRGSLFYEDLGPADALVVRSSRMSSLACTGSNASVFGRTHGSAPLSFRIDVVDAGATGDSYRIRVSNGYDSGIQPLTSGNIWVH